MILNDNSKTSSPHTKIHLKQSKMKLFKNTILKWKLVCNFGVIFHISIISFSVHGFMHETSDFLLYNNLFIYQVHVTLIYRRRSLYSFLLVYSNRVLCHDIIKKTNFTNVDLCSYSLMVIYRNVTSDPRLYPNQRPPGTIWNVYWYESLKYDDGNVQSIFGIQLWVITTW